MPCSRRALTRGAAIVVAVTLFPAGVNKLIFADTYGEAVQRLTFYPMWMRALITCHLPWVEIGIGMLIWFAGWRAACGLLAAALGCGFIVHLVLLALLGHPPCGCLLLIGEGTWMHWCVDGVLVLAGLFSAWSGRAPRVRAY